ncbi:hypothetical protein KSB_75910 [Ktedonobacter robiniae]|uniref:FAD-binding domain-containing protein n=1 Tax=Ktedonobacter robiniae TaxID=2778365 RepID=A0ABQ3V2C9_9CHLR|nr:FAD-dependent monooxygenase [Ktedonobacter robiniae]GHO59116.1 hypothetical protein KSB_75910 [Ktedonobacter robiniae]
MSKALPERPEVQEFSAQQENIHEIKKTTCCIVGAGPAGAFLALLLARQGVPVILLEAHKDFAREFRGDTIHPSILEEMQKLGLAERLLQLPIPGPITSNSIWERGSLPLTIFVA